MLSLLEHIRRRRRTPIETVHYSAKEPTHSTGFAIWGGQLVSRERERERTQTGDTWNSSLHQFTHEERNFLDRKVSGHGSGIWTLLSVSITERIHELKVEHLGSERMMLLRSLYSYKMTEQSQEAKRRRQNAIFFPFFTAIPHSPPPPPPPPQLPLLP